MLVLSRRVNEKLLIPCVQAAIQIVAVRPGGVRLGIEAPSHVVFLREEVAPAPLPAQTEARTLLINRLNNLALGLALLRRHARAGKADDLQTTLDALDQEFQGLCEQLHVCSRERGDGLWQPLPPVPV